MSLKYWEPEMTDPITPLTPEQVKQAKAQVAAEGYLHREAVALDIFVNETTGGQMDETISSRAARAALKGKLWGKLLSRFLNLFQKDHGAGAIAGDSERAENIENIEDKSGAI